MKTRTKLLIPALLCLPFTSTVHADGEELAVIVHQEASIDTLEQDDLRLIFQTYKTSVRGTKVLPLNLPGPDDARRAFDEVVLGLEPDRVTRYWIDRRIRGGNPPPKSIASPAMVLRIVAAKKEAIGYVPVSEVTPRVKVVAKIRGGTLVAP